MFLEFFVSFLDLGEHIVKTVDEGSQFILGLATDALAVIPL